MKSKLFARTFLLGVPLLAAIAFAQAGGQRVSTPAPPSTITRPDSIQDSGMYNYWASMTGAGRAGAVLLGKLSMEGEPMPWEPMLVSVDCKGSIVNSTQTDPQGRFVIRFVTAERVAEQPQDAQRQMERLYEGCAVRASLAGFRSSSVTVTIRHLRDDPDLGTITLYPEGRSSGTALSSTSQAAPSNAMKAFEKARAQWLDRDADGAVRNLKKAVQDYPAFADAWFQLGKLQEASDPQSAQDSFHKALAADPKFLLPYEQLAVMAAQKEQWQETLENTHHALELDPTGTPQIWYYDAFAKFELGKTDEAQASITKGLAIDPRHSVLNAEQLLAVILARKADYPGALSHLKNCLSYTPAGPQADLLKQQIAAIQRKTTVSK